MLSRHEFLYALDYASQQARLNRWGRPTPICDAIETAGLPLSPPKDLSSLNSPGREEEASRDPIFIAVEAASRPPEKAPSLYRLMVYAENAWEHYKKVAKE